MDLPSESALPDWSNGRSEGQILSAEAAPVFVTVSKSWAEWAHE